MILNDKAIAQKIRRMAYEIAEECFDENEIMLVGILPNGYEFARLLKQEVEKILKADIHLFSLQIDKLNPNPDQIFIKPSIESSFEQKTWIIADDVGNTGKTLFYSLSLFPPLKPKKIKTAILVERQHKRYPVASDFVGLSLSTTLKENIRVEFKGGKGTAYLE
ncbi:MAG: phosphoribosyltransferase family protein [Chitinophagales bacterium]|nr:phosphoribosyltransferase family protein [Chitinophagales bacterium]